MPGLMWLSLCAADANYQWGGHHWTQTTWNKVRVVRVVRRGDLTGRDDRHLMTLALQMVCKGLWGVYGPGKDLACLCTAGRCCGGDPAGWRPARLDVSMHACCSACPARTVHLLAHMRACAHGATHPLKSRT